MMNFKDRKYVMAPTYQRFLTYCRESNLKAHVEAWYIHDANILRSMYLNPDNYVELEGSWRRPDYLPAKEIIGDRIQRWQYEKERLDRKEEPPLTAIDEPGREEY